MQGSIPSQATQVPPNAEKAGTQKVPLKKLFEQLESSEQDYHTTLIRETLLCLATPCDSCIFVLLSNEQRILMLHK